MHFRAPGYLLAIVGVAVLSLAACSDRAADDHATSTATATTATTATTASPAAASATPPQAANGTGSAPSSAPDFDAGRAMVHLKELSQTIGPRVAGSPEDREAVEYIAGQLRAYGYDVEVSSFTYEGDRFRAGSVRTGAQEFESLTMNGSAGGTVTATAVYVGLADEAGVEGKDLAGKVAIADRGDLPFNEKVAIVQAKGAIGLVVANNEEGGFVGNAGDGARIPVVGVDDEAGAVLRTAAERGAEVTIDAPGTESASTNVLARATPGGTCRVLAGGHHDTVPAAPGALDNGSGIATMLELARAFAADGMDDGLCFAAFGAEESGLFGSKAMAAAMKANGELPAAMVNLDMTGLGDSVDLIGSPELVQRADSIAARIQVEAEPTTLGENVGSDHQSFQEVGVPVVFLTTSELGNFHTPADTLDTIDPADLDACGDLAYALITELLR